MIKTLFQYGINKMMQQQPKAPKESTEHLPRTQRVLIAANKILKGKSNEKYWLNLEDRFEHPHVFGCMIETGPTSSVKGALKYADDIENGLIRAGYTGKVFIRLSPLRIEIMVPDPPALPFRNYWSRIAAAQQNTYSFNGVLLYQGKKENLIGLSLAKPEFPHAGFFGASGSGKTVLLFNALLSLCMNTSPELLTLVLCDKTGNNLPLLNRLPHMAMPTVVAMLDIEQAVMLVVQEMQRRGNAQDKSLAKQRVVLVVDEFNQVLDLAPDVLGHCTRIAREGRQLGIHLFAAGQKLAGSKVMDPEFYQNVAVRLVGSTGGNEAEARINSGEGSIAHKLPTGKGIFELRTSGPVLGEQTPIVVRSLFIENPERDIPWYIEQIRQRWGNTATHFRLPDFQREDRKPKPAENPVVHAIVHQRKEEGPLKPSKVIDISMECTGKPVSFTQAHRLLGST